MADNKEKRKELTREYKERKNQTGIFAIKNNVTGKVFLDKTMHLDAAFNRHRFSLNMGNHKNKEMQTDWTQYGEENFSYNVVERLEEKSDDPKDTNKELDELIELCRERILETHGMKGFY